MIISISQPGYLPYLGFFKKIQESDMFVYLDDAQYEIRGWINRNRIKTNNGAKWLTVPVVKPFKKSINNVLISYNDDWTTNQLNLLESNYKNSKYFSQYWNQIKSILLSKPNTLVELNVKFIQLFNTILEIKTPSILSSSLNITSSSSEKLLDICLNQNADQYLSGEMGKGYLDESMFKKNNIDIIYQNFTSSPYNQQYSGFLDNLSVIDLIFNEGSNSKNILWNSKNL